MQLEKPVLQQGADGTFTALSFKIQPDGSYKQVATQVLGADNKPLVGKRDLTDRDKLELTNLQGQLLEKKKAIDKARTDGTATPDLVKKLADEGDAIQVRYNKTAGIPAWELTQDDPRTVLSEALKSKASPEVMQKLIAGGESKYGPAWKAQFDSLMRQITPIGEAAKPSEVAKPSPPASTSSPRTFTPTGAEPKGLIADNLNYGGFGESNRSRGSRDPAPYQAKFDSGIAAYDKMPEATPRQRSAKLTAARDLENISGYLTGDQKARAASLKDDLTRLSR